MIDEEGTGGRGKEKGRGIERGQVEEQVLDVFIYRPFLYSSFSRGFFQPFLIPLLYILPPTVTHTPRIALKGRSHFLKGTRRI